MHARVQASNRLAMTNRASHGPRVRKSKENKGKTKGTKGTIQGARSPHKGKTLKTDLSGLENWKSETSSETRESAQTCITDTSWNDGWNCKEWNDGWTF